MIIPVYNVQDYLASCVDSVLQQTYDNYEIILIDDGSPDHCGELCDGYAAKHDNITVIHKQNAGISAARNDGMRRATGDYILFLDSDDCWSDKLVLSDFAKALDTAGSVDILITKKACATTESHISGEAALKQLLDPKTKNGYAAVPVWDCVYNTAWLKANALYFPEGLVHEDVFWTPMAFANAKRCLVLDRSFYQHIKNEESITQSSSQLSIFKRCHSKVQIAAKGVRHFQELSVNPSTKSFVFSFYLGIYLSGLVEGFSLSEADLVAKMQAAVKQTSSIFQLAKPVRSPKYVFLSVLHRMFGIQAIIRFLKIKYR